MSNIANCPTCGAKAKTREKEGSVLYEGVQDEEAFNKIKQLKKVMQKFKEKAEALENELKQLKINK